MIAMSSNNLNKNNENLNNKNNVQKNSKKPINNSENKKKQTTNLIFLIIGIITLISTIILFTYEETHSFNDFTVGNKVPSFNLNLCLDD